MPVNKVLRTFFIDRRVDAQVARLAVKAGKSKNEAMRELLERGMNRLRGDASAREDVPAPGSELDEGLDESKVLRSIYLAPTFDEELRQAAFTRRSSKSALMRWFIDEGLRATPSLAPAPVARPALQAVDMPAATVRLPVVEDYVFEPVGAHAVAWADAAGVAIDGTADAPAVADEPVYVRAAGR